MEKDVWKRVERSAVFVFGIVFLAAMLVFATFIAEPTSFQYVVFKTVLALACAGVAAFVPGFITVKVNKFVRAGGAIGVFVLVYLFSPARLVAEDPSLGLLSKQQIQVFTQNLNRIKELEAEYAAYQDEYLAKSIPELPADDLLPTKRKMDEISSQINALVQQNDVLLNGKTHISDTVQKLRTTIHVMTLTKDIWSAIVDVYSDFGDKTELLEYLNSQGCLTEELKSVIAWISFSKTEIEFTKALGCIGFDKSIVEITPSDVEMAKAGLKRLGYLAEDAKTESNLNILNRFRTELSKNFSPEELSEPIYSLASAGFRKQALFYVAFYKSGLIDFSAFIAATVSDGKKKWVKSLLTEDFKPFDLEDFDELLGVLSSYYPPLLTNEMRNDLSRLRTEYQSFIASNRMYKLLASDTVASFYVNELELRLTEPGIPENVVLENPTLNLKYVAFMKRILSIQNDAIERIDFGRQPKRES